MLRPRRLASWASLLLGAWVVLSGVAHTVGSLRVNVGVKPYDFRFASLMTLGLSLVFAGLLQAAAGRGVARGEGWAFGLGVAASLFVVGLVLLLLPVLPAVGMLALNVALVGLLAWAWRMEVRGSGVVHTVNGPK